MKLQKIADKLTLEYPVMCHLLKFFIFYLFSAETSLHVPTDDEYLVMYLRPCKYYAKSAFERVSKMTWKHFLNN